MSTEECTCSVSLGCGDAPCGPCAARMSGIRNSSGGIGGPTISLDPRVASAMPAINLLADTMGIPDPFQDIANTAVGAFTAASPEDLRDYSKAAAAWGTIDAALMTGNVPANLQSEVKKARSAWGKFQSNWASARRDSGELRKQLSIAEELLMSIQSGAMSQSAGRASSKVRIPNVRRGRAIALAAIGAGAIAVGGIITMVVRK